MTPDTATLTSTYKTLDGSTVEIFAQRGTQAIGSLTGSPIDGTEFGSVVLVITDPGEEAAEITFNDMDDLLSVISGLNQAVNVAANRDPANDKPRNAEN